MTDKKGMKIVILLLIIMSCSTQPKIYEGGKYGDRKIDEEIYLVSFHGTSFSSAQETINMLYVRCAEIALENGYPYFGVIDTNWKNSRLIMDHIYTIDNKYTYTSRIKLLLKPVPGKENFDAKAIYTSRLRTIAKDEK